MKNSNDVAVCRLTAWFKATNIPYEYKNDSLYGESKNGKKVKISLSNKTRTKVSIKARASLINNRDLSVAVNEFKDIAKKLGYNVKSPLDRVLSDKRMSFLEGFELIAMRHCDFRRAPNPSKAELLKYKKVIDSAAYKFISLNYWMCKNNGLEVEDLKTYANVWTVNYLGNFKHPTCDSVENEKLLYMYLKQKYLEFFYYIKRKERNCVSDEQSYYMARHRALADVDDNFERGLANISDDEGYEEKRERLRIELHRRLDKLPHNEMVERLLSVGTSGLTKGIRKNALKVLKDHVGACNVCKENSRQ